MRGFIIKDLYMMRGNIVFLAITMMVVGIGISILTTPAVIITVTATIFSVVEVTTINIDKSCNWIKLAVAMTEDRRDYMESKYVLYLILCFLGALFGTLVSIIAMGIHGDINTYTLILFILMGLDVTLLAGSISIPATVCFNEEMAALALLLSYVVVAAAVGVIIWVIGNFFTVEEILLEIALVLFPIVLLLFFISYKVSSNIFVKMDIH